MNILSLSQVVDFTVPLYKDVYKFFMLKPNQSVSWTTFSDIFKPEFWIAIAVIGTGLIACIFIIFYFGNVKVF